MKKLNKKRTARFLLGILILSMAVTDWVVILVKCGSFTWYGLFVNMLELFTASVLLDEFFEYLEKE